MRHRVISFCTITSFLVASGLYAESPTVVAVAGPPALQLSNFDLAPLGYRTDEFFVSGTASSYKLSSAPTADGRWNALPAQAVPYTTRIVTVRPSDPKKFNGTVVVEWLNVSGGADGAADWIGLHREILGAYLTQTASTQTASRQTSPAAVSKCAPPAPGAPMFVTGDCVDPRFNDPYVDIDEQRNTPVPHRYVHGGFKGTDARFSFYFPPPEQYQGRFFQNTHQLLTSENGAAGTIAFALASGAYYVQTNIGGAERATTTEQAVFGKLDPTVGGYRVNAEAAKFSRVKANEIYGNRRIYGYLYGGSGGAFQTISSAENTVGVWDGFVPYVMGSPHSIPGVMTVRIHALRVLRIRDKFPAIMDAIDPGGSGDPYAGLNEEERGALEEATRLGFPPRGWWNHATMNGGPLALVAGYVPYLDPRYTDDFWTKPGYLGTDPKSSVSKARIQHEATLSATIEVPPNTGKVVAVEWNFDGAGAYVPAELGDIKPAVSVQATHAYSQPGIYFPVLRATSQREGDPKTQFARVQNLGRARVVVK